MRRGAVLKGQKHRFRRLTQGQREAKSSADFQKSKDSTVAKPELGTKRLCASCGAKFYDLNKDPIVCPKCETVFHPVVLATRRGGAAAAAAPVAPLAPEVEAAPEAAEVELVSLEEADAEAEGGKKDEVADGEDEVEVAEGAGAEDDTFLETDEDEGDDVSDIVGGEREDEEDT
jgi:uncharacterized protein (TIGR02300 family)